MTHKCLRNAAVEFESDTNIIARTIIETSRFKK